MNSDSGSSPCTAARRDWRTLLDDDDALVESGVDGNPVALWVPRGQDPQFWFWQRLCPLPQTEFSIEPTIRAVAASSVLARQPRPGVLRWLWRWLRRSEQGRVWFLPQGGCAREYGQPQSDLLLVWSDLLSDELNSAWLQKRWPHALPPERLGSRLYLLAGVPVPQAGDPDVLQAGCPTRRAEQLLAAAKQSGDLRRTAQALCDLGIIRLHQGDSRTALKLLEEAFQSIDSLQDAVLAADIVGNFGFVLLTSGQLPRAQALFEQELTLARQCGDPFAEQTALEHLAFAAVRRGAPAEAIPFFERALEQTRALGDPKHKADLLWHLAIQYAALGLRKEALRQARTAVAVLEQAGNPHAAWFAEYLSRYGADVPTQALPTALTITPEVTASFRDDTITLSWGTETSSLLTEHDASVDQPGLLRMAFTAVQALGRFIKSNCATASTSLLQQRLRTCAVCPDHTGVRCRRCGCFTNVKARLAHERCPMGKW